MRSGSFGVSACGRLSRTFQALEHAQGIFQMSQKVASHDVEHLDQ
jgi:hypothetical protein